MYFSKSRMAFYTNPSDYADYPGDAKELTEQQYNDACANPAKNTILSADDDGMPIRIVAAEKTNQQKMAEELRELADSYKAELQSFQFNWLSASVSDGPTEEAKKSSILADIADLKSKYLLNTAAVKLKYQ